MDFVAIDFETANGKRSSACSIGIVQVKGGKIIDKCSFLIKPPTMYFHPMNVSIHGIKAADVVNEPQFDELWPRIKGYFENHLVIAHNASFDISVLRSVLDTYGLTYPDTHYSCTLAIAKKLWPSVNGHSLKVLADRFGIKLKHHDAEEDAMACAQLAINACLATQSNCIFELAKHLNLSNGRLYPNGYEPVRAG